MVRHNDKLKLQIVNLRRTQGLSYPELSIIFNVPSSTIRNWCQLSGFSKEDSLTRANESRREALKKAELSVLRETKRFNTSQRKLVAALLYGCEGSKYPQSTGVRFSNSNPLLVKSFLELVRGSFVLNEDKLFAHLQIHTTHDYDKVRKYWSDILSIPESRFIKPTIKEPRGGKHRDNYMGTCTLRYSDYRIQLKLQGIYEGFLELICSPK